MGCLGRLLACIGLSYLVFFLFGWFDQLEKCDKFYTPVEYLTEEEMNVPGGYLLDFKFSDGSIRQVYIREICKED